MSNRAKKIVLFSSLLSLWVALTGRLDPAFILVGSVVSISVAHIVWGTFFSGFHDLPLGDDGRGLNFIFLLCFIPCFFFDLIRSTWEVSLLALRSDLSLSPSIVQIQSGLTSKTSLVFLANQITLTPGTLTMDADMAHHRLFIHVLTLGSGGTKAVKDQIYQLESRIGAITS